MLGLYATGKIPFKAVYLHGMVRDAFGQKMSKSKPETCIDPMETIEEFGADALRMALIVGNAPGTDSSLSKDKIRGMRNFANKIWNIGRFIYNNLENKGCKKYDDLPSCSKSLRGLTKEDKEIIKDLHQLIKKVTKLLEKYRFDLAAESLYHFIWHRLADEYIEYSKKRIQEDNKVALVVLRYVYFNCLKLLHPFMPFVTETIWQKLPRKYKDPLIVSSWPRL